MTTPPSSSKGNARYQPVSDKEEEGKKGYSGDNLPVLVPVVAPTALPEGYTFQAAISGDPNAVYICEVPHGGVEAGQVFQATSLKKENTNPTLLKAPTGRWKDGLFDCFSEGICHPSFCCAYFCKPIALGQVISRMRLTYLGQPGPESETKTAFYTIRNIFIGYVILHSFTGVAVQADPDNLLLAQADLVVNLVFAVWFVYAVCQTRRNVRNHYQIPEENFVGCEDVCCSIGCTCCTISQMLRHTGEYETYPGTCCSKTGHPYGTPLAV